MRSGTDCASRAAQHAARRPPARGAPGGGAAPPPAPPPPPRLRHPRPRRRPPRRAGEPRTSPHAGAAAPAPRPAPRARSPDAAWEEKRRLFYVAMTRAKEELVLCALRPARLAEETGVVVQRAVAAHGRLPARLHYLDPTPADVYLSHRATKERQTEI